MKNTGEYAERNKLKETLQTLKKWMTEKKPKIKTIIGKDVSAKT